jgi:hypothetical protein
MNEIILPIYIMRIKLSVVKMIQKCCCYKIYMHYIFLCSLMFNSTDVLLVTCSALPTYLKKKVHQDSTSLQESL